MDYSLSSRALSLAPSLTLAISAKAKELEVELPPLQAAAAENQERAEKLEAELAKAAKQEMEAELAKSEAEVAHAQVLEADQQKTRFFQYVSHEIRTPLTLILNPLELELERWSDQLL